MDVSLNQKIVCGPVEPSGIPQSITTNLIVKADKNSELLYVDGTAAGDTPIYIGLTKSRGTQDNKLPVESGDILGGLQMYARTKPGSAMGYNYDEMPLCGSIMFRAGNVDDTVETELIVALNNKTDLVTRLILDSQGNLKVSGNIELGGLTLTDEFVQSTGTLAKCIKVYHYGEAYALPLYYIL